MSSDQEIPLGLYIHLPWCIRKCPYCDFNSHEANGELPFSRYVDALLIDLDEDIRDVGGRDIVSIFIGGGTPSLFPADAIERLLDGVRQRVKCIDSIEITLEANPGAADSARFESYLVAGVNRLSIGVQSFRDRQLQLLGRVHDAAAAYAAVLAARAAGCTNINIDLMHGLPDDHRDESLDDLAKAIECEPEHISWYQLTIEPGTVFANKPPTLPEHDAIADDFERGRQLLAASGYDQYEISAYAKPGRRSHHNMNYWQFGDYLGVGAGAHGKLTTSGGIFRTEKRRSPAAFMNHAGGASGGTRHGPITGQQLASEFAMNALRLRHGYAENLFSERTGLPQADVEGPLKQAFERGWLTLEAGNIRPTDIGFRFLNDLQLLFLD